MSNRNSSKDKIKRSKRLGELQRLLALYKERADEAAENRRRSRELELNADALRLALEESYWTLFANTAKFKIEIENAKIRARRVFGRMIGVAVGIAALAISTTLIAVGMVIYSVYDPASFHN